MTLKIESRRSTPPRKPLPLMLLLLSLLVPGSFSGLFAAKAPEFFVPTQEGHISSMGRDEPTSPKNVLGFLRDMVDICRTAHRPDLEREYQDAWQVAVTHIYGPLPPRKPATGFYPATEVLPPTEPRPIWRRVMMSRPWRRVVARDGDWEILECKHRHFHTVVPGSPEAKRRRCWDCPRIEEESAAKPVQGVRA